MKRTSAMLLATGASLFVCVVAIAQSAAKKDDGDDEKFNTQLLKLCRDDIASYTLTFAEDKSSSAKFESKEVMKWTNPVRNQQLGVVCLWLKDGRAEAMHTVFTNPSEDGRIGVTHEFQSLSPRKIVAHRDRETRWSPAQAGVTLKPIPDAPEPADSPAVRLRQMRNLAREFSAHSVLYYGQETRWELRMLPQPLYRYEIKNAEKSDVLDGAVFTFVSNAGTDPELVVLIEARKANGQWVWHFAGARFSDHNLFLKHRDKDVWSFVNEGRNLWFAAGPRDSYCLFGDRALLESELKRASQGQGTPP